MKIDFSAITIYELIALILSAVAILIPIVQGIWKHFITKAKLSYLPTGRAFLFINQSGSYIQTEGVFEAERKPVSIKNCTVKIIRRKDSKALNLRWSSFTSPVNQRMLGNYTSTVEIAHPFRIEADSIACAFIEFGDFSNAPYRTLQPFINALKDEIQTMNVGALQYNQAKTQYISSEAYKRAEHALEKEMVWEIGKYDLIMEAEYGKSSVCFMYEFSVSESDVEILMHNFYEMLLIPLYDAYKMPCNFKTVQVELCEKA